MFLLIIAFISSQNTTSVVAEFNTMASCQAAAKEVQKQAEHKPRVILCADKG